MYHSAMRRVARNDADELAELEALLFPDNNFNETTLASEIDLGFGWVLTNGGAIVAYALVRDDGQLLDLTRLGVHPVYQSSGLGTILLEEVVRMNRQTMLTVRAENRGALRLYFRHGFEIVGCFMDTNGVHAWTLVRQPPSEASTRTSVRSECVGRSSRRESA